MNFWLPIPFGGASYLSLRFGHPRTAQAKAHTKAQAKALPS